MGMADGREGVAVFENVVVPHHLRHCEGTLVSWKGVPRSSGEFPPFNVAEDMLVEDARMLQHERLGWSQNDQLAIRKHAESPGCKKQRSGRLVQSSRKTTSAFDSKADSAITR
jgi:hypothetical protein